MVIYYKCRRFCNLAGVQERRLLTIPQAAKEIGMSRAALWRHVKAEHVKAEQHGPYLLIDSEELARFNANRRGPGRPPKTAAN